MPETYIGFNQGQYGDLFINLTACKVLKNDNPDCKIIFSVNKKFKQIIPVLTLSEDIDEFVLWDDYENWPSTGDSANFNKIAEQLEGDKLAVFQPMQDHTISDWYNYWHQAEEICVMHGLRRPTEEELDFKLLKPEIDKEETITICTGRRIEKHGRMNPKALTLDQIEVVKKFSADNKLKLIQIGGPEEEEISGVEKFKGAYSEAVHKVLKSKILVSCDTGMIWAASAFTHPTLGLYDLAYYEKAKDCLNWTPKNKKQITLLTRKMENMDLNDIENKLRIMNASLDKHVISHSEHKQDLFALKIVKKKGSFLDIGAAHPIGNNNSKALENSGWSGLAFDYNVNPDWQNLRECDLHGVDATSDDFIDILSALKLKKVGYISLDIDENSLNCLEKILDYGLKFKCMTFEHTWDLNNMDQNYVEDSRKLLEEKGYKLLFKNIIVENPQDEHAFKPFEDWWVDKQTYKRYNKTYENLTPTEAVLILK